VWLFFLDFVTFFYMFSQSWQYRSNIIDSPSERNRFFTPSKESFLYTLKGIVSRIDVIFDWSEKRRFFDFCKSPIFRIFTEKLNRQNTNVYNKDGTRLQNKGVNLIVCLIFWTLKWFMYDTLTTPFTVSPISSRR
jgi:hypothetical protein